MTDYANSPKHSIDQSVYHLQPSERPSETVVRLVANVTGSGLFHDESSDDSDPVLDPIYGSIDPDALDALFETDSSGIPRTDASVTFSFNDQTVVVGGDGRVTIEPVLGEE